MAASDTVKRIDLPSGGWWEIETRPTFRDVLAMKRVESDDGEIGAVDVFGVLITLTRAWSYDDPISSDIFLDLKADDERLDDLVPVMRFFQSDVVPFLGTRSSKSRPNPNGSLSRSSRAKSRRSTRSVNS